MARSPRCALAFRQWHAWKVRKGCSCFVSLQRSCRCLQHIIFALFEEMHWFDKLKWSIVFSKLNHFSCEVPNAVHIHHRFNNGQLFNKAAGFCSITKISHQEPTYWILIHVGEINSDRPHTAVWKILEQHGHGHRQGSGTQGQMISPVVNVAFMHHWAKPRQTVFRLSAIWRWPLALLHDVKFLIRQQCCYASWFQRQSRLFMSCWRLC